MTVASNIILMRRPSATDRTEAQAMLAECAPRDYEANEAPFVHIDEPDALTGFEIDTAAIKRDLRKAVLVAAGWFCGGVGIAIIEAFRRGIWTWL